MRILGFDTATPATTVALAIDGRELEARDDPPPGQRPAHTTRLMPLIVELLERAALGWEALDRIAVGIGPGTFTGLRIGVATARGLAFARGIPLVGISTLRSLALNAEREAEVVIAVLDARRGEVFAAAWPSAREASLLEPSVLEPAELGPLVRRVGPGALAIGDGAVKFRGALEQSGALVPEDDSALHRVTAINHCRLASRTPAGDPDQVRPAYLRLPDAEISRRSAGNR